MMAVDIVTLLSRVANKLNDNAPKTNAHTLQFNISDKPGLSKVACRYADALIRTS
jgi:hypothetical protein